MRFISRNGGRGSSALFTLFAMMMLLSAETPPVGTLTERVGALSLIIGLPCVVAYAIGETLTRR